MAKGPLHRIYQLLPHDVRRQVFRLRRPDTYRLWQEMRTREDHDDYTFAPFDRYRCIFIHVPKCAGVAVSESLFGGLAGGHRSIGHYQMIFRKKEFDGYFKFAFIRNPWDRLVSAFHFLKQGGFNETDRLWAQQHLSRYNDFDSFVRNWVTPENIWSWVHFIPQTHFICIDGKPSLDFIGRYEKLESDFRFIQSQLGIRCRLTSLNRRQSVPNDFKSYYSDETREIVARIYSSDITTLGYCFENSNIDLQQADLAIAS
ncbi:MAG: sulfotransferase family 2 domain-containing protein [Pirellulales bacterium]